MANKQANVSNQQLNCNITTNINSGNRSHVQVLHLSLQLGCVHTVLITTIMPSLVSACFFTRCTALRQHMASVLSAKVQRKRQEPIWQYSQNMCKNNNQKHHCIHENALLLFWNVASQLQWVLFSRTVAPAFIFELFNV